MRPLQSAVAHASTTSWPEATAQRLASIVNQARVPRHATFPYQRLVARPFASGYSTSSRAMSAIKVSLHERAFTSTDHHVGNPPKSFRNPWPSSASSTSGLLGALKTRFGSDRNLVPIPTDGKELVPVRKPDWGAGEKGIKATWFGHASFFVEASAADGAERGVRILLDPVFSKRMSPVNFAGPLRFVDLPCQLEEVSEADLVVISHNHYDHLDSKTIEQLYQKRGPGNIHFFCSLGVQKSLEGMGIAAADITECDWWQEITVDVKGLGSLRLTCTPSQHFSGRGILDQGHALWCSWVFRDSQDARLFFAGDTGYRSKSREALAAGDDTIEALPYCPVFKEIGSKYGPFDLSLLPIGCYSPRHALSTIHCSPEDSVKIHRDVKSRKSIGMHFGTIRGGISQFYEPVTDPPRVWREACDKAGLKWGDEVGLLDIGETVTVQAAGREAQLPETRL